jgi:DNA polymerase III alpha subunit (gram-positive type)
MKLFFFDTETTWLYPWIDRIIQFWWIEGILDEETFEFKETDRINQLINIHEHIPAAATAVHWLTNKDLEWYDYMDSYLPRFLELINNADYVVWHNIIFDANMIYWECKINWVEFHPWQIQWIDTMKPSTELVNWLWWRWPKLRDLHQFLFWFEFEDAHDAMADIEATKNCFLELCRKYHFYEDWCFKDKI